MNEHESGGLKKRIFLEQGKAARKDKLSDPSEADTETDTNFGILSQFALTWAELAHYLLTQWIRFFYLRGCVNQI